MLTSVELDQTDHEIIELLRQDARRTLADVAAHVSLSAPAVKRRIDRLGKLGVILGYTIHVDHAKLGRPIEAFIELRFAGTTPVDDIPSTAAGIPEVETLSTIAGDPDALVQVRVDDVAHLKDVIDRLRRTGRVTGSKTLIVLDRWSRVTGTSHPQRAPRQPSRRKTTRPAT